MKRKGQRYLGVDLHHDSFVVCLRQQQRVVEFRSWRMEQMVEFIASLQAEDQLAVEATGNTRWFCRQVGERVKRVVVVNPHQFRVICDSTKKTDRRDAVLLAEYLEKDLLRKCGRRARSRVKLARDDKNK